VFALRTSRLQYLCSKASDSWVHQSTIASHVLLGFEFPWRLTKAVLLAKQRLMSKIVRVKAREAFIALSIPACDAKRVE
jgi:hypothetical protein